MTEEGLSAAAIKMWDEFWIYFVKQWIPILDAWNICDKDGEYKDIQNRTNNGLESYNRRFNKMFPERTSLIEFCKVVEEESRYQARLLRDIRKGVVDESTYPEVTIPPIPDAYTRFVAEINLASMAV